MKKIIFFICILSLFFTLLKEKGNSNNEEVISLFSKLEIKSKALPLKRKPTNIKDESLKKDEETSAFSNIFLSKENQEIEQMLELEANEVSTDKLVKLLDHDSRDIYLLALEELLTRSLNEEEIDLLIDNSLKLNGDSVSKSLIRIFKIGKADRRKIYESFSKGISKNFETAWSLSEELYRLKLGFEEFQTLVNKSCQYIESEDQELSRSLINSFRRQSDKLGLVGIYFCDKF